MKGITVKILTAGLVAGAFLVFMSSTSGSPQQAQPKAEPKAEPKTDAQDKASAKKKAKKEEPEVSAFPDKNLEDALRQYVIGKKGTNRPVTKDDAKIIATIEAPGKGIRDLTGIEYCLSLTSLHLAGNEISDLTPLLKLANIEKPDTEEVGSQIKFADLSKNKITSPQGLSALKKLEYLQLADNQIEELAELSGLARLADLYLSNNKVKDLSPLAGLTKMTTLYLDGNQVTDLAPLAKMSRLASLELKGNQVSDLAPLASLTSLRYLSLAGNKVKNLAPLAAAAKKDYAGEKRFAPYLKIDIDHNPLAPASKAQIAELKNCGVTIMTGATQAGPATKSAPGSAPKRGPAKASPKSG